MEIHDVVHGTIWIPADIASIINTKLFQRLKSIRQLGLMAGIDAKHSRFHHCIGSYYLARKMLQNLEARSKCILNNIPLPLVYRKAVEIAALLHDIGHGPFSHSWEQVGHNYIHEENAVPCVDAIFESLNDQSFKELRQNNNFGIELIKALILSNPKYLPEPLSKQYWFIFEIVSNKQCKVDVDKWDYLKRDFHYIHHLCNSSVNFDDVFLEAKVSNDGAHIEYRYKDYEKIYTLFKTRWNFHRHCYRSPRNLISDKILQTIVRGSDKCLGNEKLMEVNAYNMSAFIELTDERVFELISEDKYRKYLHEHATFKRIQKDEVDKEYLDKMFYVEDVIIGPGKEMPPDERFHFYGNECDKQVIQRNNSTIKRSICFYINDREQTVYYYLTP